MTSVGEVITFYSFKGGTGRTMALANVATSLSIQRPQWNIHLLDWDLEAPGLHQFFERQLTPPAIERIRQGNQPGLLDLLSAIKSAVDTNERNIGPGTDEEEDEFFAKFDFERFVVHVESPRLDFIPAGAFDDKYPSRV